MNEMKSKYREDKKMKLSSNGKSSKKTKKHDKRGIRTLAPEGTGLAGPRVNHSAILPFACLLFADYKFDLLVALSMGNRNKFDRPHQRASSVPIVFSCPFSCIPRS